MALSISHPHPLGFQNPRVLRAWAALPANNAWDGAPTVAPCAGYWWVRLYFTYQQADGAGQGSLDYYYDLSPYEADASASNEAWFHGTLYTPGPLTACQMVHSRVQQEFITYCPTSEDAETFISPPIHLGGCIQRVRVFCRQAPGTGLAPGNAEVIGLFYVEG